jgi:hypothetical protein
MATFASLSVQFTDDFLGDRGQRAGFVLLAAFLLSFAFIRTSARLMRSPRAPWWPGSVETSSGLHIHHLVWGIVLVLVTGFFAFAIQPGSPWLELLAAGFGIGTGLTLDEFALWLHLEDVYWSEKGRQSLDAVVVAAVFGALVVIGAAPFDLEDERSIAVIALAVAAVVACSALAILKGKLMLGLVGLFVPAASLVGALRLAKPRSPWARWRYSERYDKLARASDRNARYETRQRRWLDRIGGAPSRDR